MLTWTCHACGQERPDDLIGVATAYGTIPSPARRLNGDGASFAVNQRYCVDRVECFKTAQAQAVAIRDKMEAGP